MPERDEARLNTIIQLSILLNEYDKKITTLETENKALKKDNIKYRGLYNALLKLQQLNLFKIYNSPQ